jgi:hypothetical protein
MQLIKSFLSLCVPALAFVLLHGYAAQTETAEQVRAREALGEKGPDQPLRSAGAASVAVEDTDAQAKARQALS